jgi:hypothetical protein
MKRYQECNKLTKLWRKRWYILAPFIFISHYIYYRRNRTEKKWYDIELLWSIVIGNLQVRRMKFYWESDELLERIKNKSK